MEKLTFTITINAPRETVWHTMLDDRTYRQWTVPFHPGSYYEGGWNKGDSIKFYGPNEDGTVSGMYSRIKESRQYEYVSIEHLGEIQNGVEKPWGEGFGGALENYTFTETPEGTQVLVEIDSPIEYKGMFEDMWPKALEKLKALAEAEQ